MRIIAEHTNQLECHDCGRRQQLPEICSLGAYQCAGCGHRLHRERRNWAIRSLALTVAGLILLALSSYFPFMALEFGALKQQTTLLSGVWTLLENRYLVLALLVFGTIFLFPLIELLCLTYVLLPVVMNRRFPFQVQALKWINVISRWNMMEVFLLGVLVCAVKLQVLADVVPGVALYAFFALVLVLLAAQSNLNRRALWSHLDANDRFSGRPGEALVACHCCQALVGQSLITAGLACPRCRSAIHRRIPASLQKTAALLVAAVVLYVPANTLPIMTTTALGQTQADTIMSGVLYLLDGDAWPLAVIVFVASVVVPISKIMILGYLWWTTYRGSTTRLRHRMRLYRLSEFVGHWSMVDVYVVILMVALVQFGLLANVEAGGAAMAFAGVVILTMLAAQSFDPRLIWDAEDGKR